MALLRKFRIDSSESEVQNFIPGENITFATQSDGTIQINASGGGSGGPDIRSMVAPVETGTASGPYGYGDGIIIGGNLYRASTAIASGDTLTPGTNLDSIRVMDYIKLAHTPFLHTLTQEGWSASTSTAWGREWYTQILNVTDIYNFAADVIACGTTVGDAATASEKSLVGAMEFVLSDTDMTITAYSPSLPSSAVNISVEGVA